MSQQGKKSQKQKRPAKKKPSIDQQQYAKDVVDSIASHENVSEKINVLKASLKEDESIVELNKKIKSWKDTYAETVKEKDNTGKVKWNKLDLFIGNNIFRDSCETFIKTTNAASQKTAWDNLFTDKYAEKQKLNGKGDAGGRARHDAIESLKKSFGVDSIKSPEERKQFVSAIIQAHYNSVQKYTTFTSTNNPETTKPNSEVQKQIALLPVPVPMSKKELTYLKALDEEYGKHNKEGSTLPENLNTPAHAFFEDGGKTLNKILSSKQLAILNDLKSSLSNGADASSNISFNSQSSNEKSALIQIIQNDLQGYPSFKGTIFHSIDQNSDPQKTQEEIQAKIDTATKGGEKPRIVIFNDANLSTNQLESPSLAGESTGLTMQSVLNGFYRNENVRILASDENIDGLGLEKENDSTPLDVLAEENRDAREKTTEEISPTNEKTDVLDLETDLDEKTDVLGLETENDSTQLGELAQDNSDEKQQKMEALGAKDPSLQMEEVQTVQELQDALQKDMTDAIYDVISNENINKEEIAGILSLSVTELGDKDTVRNSINAIMNSEEKFSELHQYMDNNSEYTDKMNIIKDRYTTELHNIADTQSESAIPGVKHMMEDIQRINKEKQRTDIRQAVANSAKKCATESTEQGKDFDTDTREAAEAMINQAAGDIGDEEIQVTNDFQADTIAYTERLLELVKSKVAEERGKGIVNVYDEEVWALAINIVEELVVMAHAGTIKLEVEEVEVGDVEIEITEEREVVEGEAREEVEVGDVEIEITEEKEVVDTGGKNTQQQTHPKPNSQPQPQTPQISSVNKNAPSPTFFNNTAQGQISMS